MSQISVVVMSMKPVSMPLSASFSIVRPPVPVAWNTMQSKSFFSRSAIAVTQGVVTPNMVSPMEGLASRRCGGFCAMPAIACAALLRMVRLRSLRPARSVTDGTITISEMPT